MPDAATIMNPRQDACETTDRPGRPAAPRGGARQSARRQLRRILVALPVFVWLGATVAAMLIHRDIAFTGNVCGYAESRPVTLAHWEAGVVRTVNVDLYERVVPGQVLLALDDSAERNELAVMEKDVERLQGEIQAEAVRLAADNARADADVHDLSRRYAVDRETAHVEYLQQLVQLARDRILLRGAQIEHDIVEALREDGSAPFREMNTIETDLDALVASIEQREVVVARCEKAFEESDQRSAAFCQHENVDTDYEPVLTPLRLAVEVQRRNLDDIVRRIDAHVIRAPIEGQVTQLAVNVGESVARDVPLIAIAPTAANRVVAYLPEAGILSTTPGARVLVHCNAAAPNARRDYVGRVVRLADSVTEMPPRYRTLPNRPLWGRGLLISLSDDAALIPGESVTIAFTGPAPPSSP